MGEQNSVPINEIKFPYTIILRDLPLKLGSECPSSVTLQKRPRHGPRD